MAPTWRALVDGAMYVDARLTEIIDELAPDVIVEDNVVGFPALAASGRPWVRIVSCNPTELKDPAVPPFSSGYPVADRGELAGVPGRGRTDPSRPVGRIRYVLPRAWRRGAPLRPERPRLHLGIAVAQPVRLSGRGGLRRAHAPSARPGTASTRSVRAADSTWELPEAPARPRRRAHLPVARVASGPPTSD